MKLSIRLKMTLMLVSSLVVLILISWFLNNSFLDDYYQAKKVKLLSESFFSINQISGRDDVTVDSEFINQIERIEASESVNIYICDSYAVVFGRTLISLIYPAKFDSWDGSDKGYFKLDRVGQSLEQYINPDSENNKLPSAELLTSDEIQYNVYKSYDPKVDSTYIDLVGNLDNGYLVIIRSNYENISESAKFSSTFLAIVGAFVIVLGVIIMLVFSKRFTDPILEIADISDKMAGLDFESKYTGKRNDEIGRLGNSMNALSEKLENAITELKTANIELERDIAHKIELDELRKEFLSNVSHELKTPIALIQGYAEGLQDNINDDPESRSFYCDVIIDEARKMNNMVKKLLSLNEIEFGSNKLELVHFDIVGMVRQMTSEISLLAKSKDIEVIFNEHEPVWVWADESLIEEVITNYLSNALNHVSGANVIDVSFKDIDGKLRVSVFNTGEAIPEEELDNIWVKFYKVDKARTREYGGSGIGLSIVKAIMEQHNQAYGVKNHTAGVEFWFELDAKIEE